MSTPLSQGNISSPVGQPTARQETSSPSTPTNTSTQPQSRNRPISAQINESDVRFVRDEPTESNRHFRDNNGQTFVPQRSAISQLESNDPKYFPAYVGAMERRDAENLLLTAAPGVFLVRWSDNR